MPSRTGEGQHRTSWRGLVVSLLGAALAIALLAHAGPLVVRALHVAPTDGQVDWHSARSFWRHENPYDPKVYTAHGLAPWGGVGHQPTTAFWFLPFADVPLADLPVALAVPVLLLLALHLALLFGELRVTRPLLATAVAFAAVLGAPWFLDHLSMGQISEPIAFAYVLAWVLLRRGEQVGAGVTLGLAATLKLYPGVMILFLLVTRRLRAFAAACVSFAAVAVVMTARYGFAAWTMFFSQQGGIGARWMGHIRNASLQSVLIRLVTRGCAMKLDPRPAVTVAAAALALALVALALWFVSARRRVASLDLAFVLIAGVSAIVNPWIWEHYHVLLLMPMAVVPVELWRARRAGLPTRWVVAGVAGLALVAAAQMVTWFGGFYTRMTLAARGGAALGAGDHFTMHAQEVAYWLPAPLLVAMAAALMAWRRSDAAPAAARS